MIILAILIGIYANCLLSLGLLGVLDPVPIGMVTFVFICSVAFLLFKKRKGLAFYSHRFSGFEKMLLALLFIQGGVTLIGVLGPEIAFDALWYHLTLPKLYIQYGLISHIQGGLLYYSFMPQLTEMLYIPALVFADERVAKLIHFLFGAGTCFLLYTFSRKYLPRSYALLTVLLFSSNLIVGWEAITSYIDLSRTFFELCAFVTFVYWIEKRRVRYLLLSAVLLGLAVSTKLLALSSLPVFILLIVMVGKHYRKSLKQILKEAVLFCALTVFIPSPWFISSLLATGNPFYPFFTDLYNIGNEYNVLLPHVFLRDIWVLFTSSSDPISPIYLISLPLIILSLIKKKNGLLLYTFLFILFSLVIWFVLPRVGGGRFILPYLPVFSFLVMYAVTKASEIPYYKKIANGIVLLILFYSLVFIGYRSAANSKFIPYVLGRESKSEFLTKHLDFSFGDFYDADGYFAKHITKEDRVLLIGFHNLYYVDFPFIDGSYVKNGDEFNYIAVQHSELPMRFKDWNLVYANSQTGVRLYSTGGMKWVY